MIGLVVVFILIDLIYFTCMLKLCEKKGDHAGAVEDGFQKIDKNVFKSGTTK